MQLLNINTQSVTMSSLELVDFINAGRESDAPQLAHSDFLKKVVQVLGEKDAGNFSSIYLDAYKREKPCYKLPKREACLMAMSYSYELQAKVFDKMTALEAQQAPKLPTDYISALEALLESKKSEALLTNELAIAAPKVAVYEMLADRKQDVSTTIIAKQIGTSAIKLNQFLRDAGVKWLNADLPKAGFMDWFNIVSDVKNGHEFQQCMVTPHGQIEIAKLWNAQNKSNKLNQVGHSSK